MEKFNPKSVFDLHPDAKVIYEVDGMPFLRKVDADSYALSIKSKVVEHSVKGAAAKEEVATEPVVKEVTAKEAK